ncbi:hypothetical protein PVAP13_1NG196519 [Panicum virgatum]|uniref:Uncharacterized protein n=1 Tax=Panicum virgatum TaxID=38727 RepID=A0A8T0WWD4_PANVG|nr:hypothetical protein PVAP13_1NG196519 [Panicum virgatum]
MEPSDSLLSHTEDVQRGSPWDHSTRREELLELSGCTGQEF